MLPDRCQAYVLVVVPFLVLALLGWYYSSNFHRLLSRRFQFSLPLLLRKNAPWDGIREEKTSWFLFELSFQAMSGYRPRITTSQLLSAGRYRLLFNFKLFLSFFSITFGVEFCPPEAFHHRST